MTTPQPEPQPLPEPATITRGNGQSIVWRGFDQPAPAPQTED